MESVETIETPLPMEPMETPLSAAAKAGRHEIVAYLLSIPGVSAEGVAKDEVLVSKYCMHQTVSNVVPFHLLLCSDFVSLRSLASQ